MAFKYSNGIMYSHGEVEGIQDELADLTAKANQRCEIIDSSIEAIEYFFETNDFEELRAHLKYLKWLQKEIENE